jgi:Family of unknown function (DUF5675)
MVISVRPSKSVPQQELDQNGGQIPIMNYQRGTEIIRELGSKAIAVRGTLEVRGKKFDTIERAGGYVYLREAIDLYLCHMEESPTHNGRKQIRPAHTIHNTKDQVAAISIHPGDKPSHFLGCIGVGKKSAEGLSHSVTAMSELFQLLGGFKSGTKVFLQVTGDMPVET